MNIFELNQLEVSDGKHLKLLVDTLVNKPNLTTTFQIQFEKSFSLSKVI